MTIYRIFHILSIAWSRPSITIGFVGVNFLSWRVWPTALPWRAISTMNTVDRTPRRRHSKENRHIVKFPLKLEAPIWKTVRNQIGARKLQYIPGDLVLIWNIAIEKELNRKTKPRYLGPYKVVRRTQGGSYKLAKVDGAQLARPIAAFRVIPYIQRNSLRHLQGRGDESDIHTEEEEEIQSDNGEQSEWNLTKLSRDLNTTDYRDSNTESDIGWPYYQHHHPRVKSPILPAAIAYSQLLTPSHLPLGSTFINQTSYPDISFYIWPHAYCRAN